MVFRELAPVIAHIWGLLVFGCRPKVGQRVAYPWKGVTGDADNFHDGLLAGFFLAQKGLEHLSVMVRHNILTNSWMGHQINSVRNSWSACAPRWSDNARFK